MKLKHGSRYETNGWTVLSIKGTASERGYAHGYLIAPELKEVFKMLDFSFLNSYGYSRDFICDAVSELFKPQIIKNYPELYEEMEYIAKGATANGTKISVTMDINSNKNEHSLLFVTEKETYSLINKSKDWVKNFSIYKNKKKINFKNKKFNREILTAQNYTKLFMSKCLKSEKIERITNSHKLCDEIIKKIYN